MISSCKNTKHNNNKRMGLKLLGFSSICYKLLTVLATLVVIILLPGKCSFVVFFILKKHNDYCCCFHSTEAHGRNMVCYYTNSYDGAISSNVKRGTSRSIDDIGLIDPWLCSHIIIIGCCSPSGSAHPASSIVINDRGFAEVTALRLINLQLKVMVSFTGTDAQWMNAVSRQPISDSDN